MQDRMKSRNLLQARELPLLIFVTILTVVLSFSISGFFSIRNFEVISRQLTTTGIVSIGMTLVIITGGIDLSVGAILSFSINVGGQLIAKKVPIHIVYTVMLLIGLILGAMNGFLIVRLKIPALIVTLGTMNIFRGAIMIITRGKYITSIPTVYSKIGRGYIPFIIFIILLLILDYVLRRTKFGRNLIAIGSNEMSAAYSGVSVDKAKIITYSINGFLATLAGIVLIGRSGFIQPQAGIGYEMAAIATVVIGGTSITGGFGTLRGTFLGALLMGLISAGITMLAINAYWQGVTNGMLIIAAIAMDALRNMRRRQRE